ncbi:MAG: hypothetical protein RLZZ397_341 [Pseudomonadota bacterium]
MPQLNRLGVWVEVRAVRGSTPREAGAWMSVGLSGLLAGTVGGGHLEFDAIAKAQAFLSELQKSSSVDPLPPFEHTYKLGPHLGQCCGGEVLLQFTPMPENELQQLVHQRLQSDKIPVTLFGAGHIGHALIAMGQRLPIHWWWIDSRDGVFPSGLGSSVVCEHSTPVHDAVDDAVQGRHVLIMSFSHSEDFDILERILQKMSEGMKPLSIGLIGSATKWSSFKSRLMRKGYSEEQLAQVRCPVGLAGLRSKEPSVVALSVLAELFALNPLSGH